MRKTSSLASSPRMYSCVTHQPHAGSQESVNLLHDLNRVFIREEIADSDILRTICHR